MFFNISSIFSLSPHATNCSSHLISTFITLSSLLFTLSTIPQHHINLLFSKSSGYEKHISILYPFLNFFLVSSPRSCSQPRLISPLTPHFIVLPMFLILVGSSSGSFEYIYIVFLRQPFSSRPHSMNWSTMAALWHSAVPSSGMMSPARKMVLQFLLFVRTPKMTFIISVHLWIVASGCNCLTWIEFTMALPDQHLVRRDKALRIFLMYLMHGIIFETSELVLVAISTKRILTRMQLGGV